MLDQLRRSAASWLVRGLMGLLILSFGIWGIADYLTASSDPVVARIGEVRITQSQFADQFRRDLARLQAQFGVSIDVEQARRTGLVQASLRQAIDQALLRQAISANGLTISDQVVREAITADPDFQSVGQKFDRALFESRLRASGMSEALYVSELRHGIAVGHLLGALGAGVKAAPQTLSDALYRYRNERRIAEYFLLPASLAADVPEPSEEAVTAYYQEHGARFTEPERRQVSYLAVHPADLLGQIEVSETEIREDYEARRATFETPERREIEQVVYANADEAKAALARVRQGESLVSVAEKTRGLKPSDVALGKLRREDLPSAIVDAVFGLAPGAVSEPLPSQVGWHLVRVVAVEPKKTRTLEQARDELRREIAISRAMDRLIGIRNRLDDILASGASLEEAGRELGLKVQTIAPFDSQGNDAQGRPAANLPKTSGFLQAVFAAVEQAEPTVQEEETGGVYAFRVDSITPPTLRPLDGVRPEITSTLRAAARSQALAEKARALADRAKTGEAFTSLAQEVGATIERAEPLQRSAPERVTQGRGKFSAALIGALFALKPGETASGVSAKGDSHIVARLIAVEAAEPKNDSTAREKMRKALTESIIGDLMARYRAHLASSLGVEIDQAALESAL
jgi:peptidyl-prolyl cis-trans isomerase D